jgi:aspartate-semialdehyde dehydrogenase
LRERAVIERLTPTSSPRALQIHKHRGAPGKDDMPEGRIRRDLGDPSACSIMMVVGSDQLRNWAALIVVEIAEKLEEQLDA